MVVYPVDHQPDLIISLGDWMMNFPTSDVYDGRLDIKKLKRSRLYTLI